MSKKPKTEEEEDNLREEVFAIKEMAETKGFQALKKRIDNALESIKNQKTTIVTEIDNRFLSDTAIARQYVSLDERKNGIKAVLNEVNAAIKQAENFGKKEETK